MISLGVKPLGLNPLTSTSLYRKIIVPIVLYGCELWTDMRNSEILEIERFQRYIVKRIQGLPIRTRTDMCEPMLGLYPISCDILIRKLMFLYKLLSLPTDSISQLIFLRKLFLYMSDNDLVTRGFIPEICKILYDYNLHFILKSCSDASLLPSKYTWKHLVRTAVLSKQTELWRSRLEADDDFMRFRKLHTSISPAIVWGVATCHNELKLCDFVARLWTIIPSKNQRICVACKQVYYEPVQHVVADCVCNKTLRDSFISSVCASFPIELHDLLYRADSETFLLILLGAPSEIILDYDMWRQFLLKAYMFVKACFQ